MRHRRQTNAPAGPASEHERAWRAGLDEWRPKLAGATAAMTLTYARISDRTVAEEYFRVTEAVESGYQSTVPMPGDVEGPNMRRLAADHRRLLGNGQCTRPRELDCTFESICERCGFLETGPQFVPILRKQRHHAADDDQADRAQLFTSLLDGIDADD